MGGKVGMDKLEKVVPVDSCRRSGIPRRREGMELTDAAPEAEIVGVGVAVVVVVEDSFKMGLPRWREGKEDVESCPPSIVVLDPCDIALALPPPLLLL